MLEQTALGERADDEVSKLSGGNRQRVNIAIGLLGDPAVLLLDEPSASLDPRQRERLWDFLNELGTTVLFSTHDVGEAERQADRLLVLADGELLFTGTPAQLETATGGDAAAPDFETAFVRFLHDTGPLRCPIPRPSRPPGRVSRQTPPPSLPPPLLPPTHPPAAAGSDT